jgi:hypothetical protein
MKNPLIYRGGWVVQKYDPYIHRIEYWAGWHGCLRQILIGWEWL